jgi:hypothetical protein
MLYVCVGFAGRPSCGRASGHPRSSVSEGAGRIRSRARQQSASGSDQYCASRIGPGLFLRAPEPSTSTRTQLARVCACHGLLICVLCVLYRLCAPLTQISSFAAAHECDVLESLVLFHQHRGVGDEAKIKRAMLRAMADSLAMRLDVLRHLFCSVEQRASQLPPHVAEPPLNRLAADLIAGGLVASLLESLQVCELWRVVTVYVCSVPDQSGEADLSIYFCLIVPSPHDASCGHLFVHRPPTQGLHGSRYGDSDDIDEIKFIVNETEFVPDACVFCVSIICSLSSLRFHLHFVSSETNAPPQFEACVASACVLASQADLLASLENIASISTPSAAYHVPHSYASQYLQSATVFD